jgi:FkbM family methyltransferase
VKLPFTHRIAFAIASSGWRGSQFLWKIATRLQKVNEGEIVRLPNGFPIRIDSKDWISKTIYEGTYERALLHFLDSLVLKDCSIDVGANIGVTLWHGLKNSNLSATYMAFEPSSQCFEALESTCADLNNSGKIYDFAIGSADESRSIYGLGNQLHSGAASLISHSGVRGEKGEVQVRKLDSVLQEYLGDRLISLLKVDTEGYEAQVVTGATDSISKGKIEIIIMEVSPNFGSVEYLTYLNQLLGEKYSWFALSEQGSIKRRPCLDEISLNQALAFNQQWNLVLIQKDVLKNYQKRKIRIAVNQSKK